MSGTTRQSQTDRAIMGLRAAILDGRYAAGSRLSEVVVSDSLGLSRTPLRQAMDRLVAEGLLERVPSGGCRVVSFTRRDVEDAIELRGTIEGTAARLAAERGGDPMLLVLADEILSAIDRALDPQAFDFGGYVEANAQFHDILAQLAGSAMVEREVRRVNSLPLASPSAFLQGQETVPDFRASLSLAQLQHRQILEAIRAREGARADALCREHARLARRNLDFVVSSGPVLTRRIPGFTLVSDNR